MSRDTFEFIFRYLHVSYDGNGRPDEADNDNDDSNYDDNDENVDNGHFGVGEEEDGGGVNDASDDPYAYNHTSEEFGQNTIDDADENFEVEEGKSAKGVAPSITVEVWYEKVSECIEFMNKQALALLMNSLMFCQ